MRRTSHAFALDKGEKRSKAHPGQRRSAGRKRRNQHSKAKLLTSAAKNAGISVTELVKRREAEAQSIRVRYGAEMNTTSRVPRAVSHMAFEIREFSRGNRDRLP